MSLSLRPDHKLITSIDLDRAKLASIGEHLIELILIHRCQWIRLVSGRAAGEYFIPPKLPSGGVVSTSVPLPSAYVNVDLRTVTFRFLRVRDQYSL